MKKLLLLLSLSLFLVSCGDDDETVMNYAFSDSFDCSAIYPDGKVIEAQINFQENGKYVLKIFLSSDDIGESDNSNKYPIQFVGRYTANKSKDIKVTLSNKADLYKGYWHNLEIYGEGSETDNLKSILSVHLTITGNKIVSTQVNNVITLN